MTSQKLLFEPVPPPPTNFDEINSTVRVYQYPNFFHLDSYDEILQPDNTDLFAMLIFSSFENYIYI